MKYTMLSVSLGLLIPLHALQKYSTDKACHLTSCLSCFTAKQVALEKKVSRMHTLSPFYKQLLEPAKMTTEQSRSKTISRLNFELPLNPIPEEDECCEPFTILLNDEPWHDSMK